ncbi:MAG TPA: FAD-dependent monooxygenase [Xanthobacteraceae bacterium]|nr:FAD-dependent monooxygenase [Xanthobacteraceae bacterium]
MGEAVRVPVLIVGGGPVGLALAVDLGWRNVPCLVVEQGDGEVVDAKMFATGIRTVEFCRRWGIAEKVRHWGFPEDFPFDNVFVTSLNGHEIGRIPMPALQDIPPFPTSPEGFAHCPQFVFDPILAEKARTLPSVTLRYHTQLTSFRDTGDGVTAELLDLKSGQREEVRADYLVGCDGIGSTVRKELGIEMRGTGLINHSFNVMFRVPELWNRHNKGKAGRYVIVGEEGTWASLTPADGKDLWRLMIHGELDTDPDTVDPETELRRAIGNDTQFEIVKFGHWLRRHLVADSYGRGRVLLAGDAVHVMPPNGGLGMNTGLGDSVDLGWKLAAIYDGWGGEHLIESYEAERRPVGIRQCDEAMENFQRYGSRKPVPHVTDETPDGARVRTELGKRLSSANSQAWENPLNTHLGYRYEDSPIVVPDGPLPPEPEDSRHYTQTSHPGCRAPHAWLQDGRSTLDLFGTGFTLIRLPDAPNSDAIAEAFRSRGVPLNITYIDDPAIAALYVRKLVLVRPDGHVAWRGDLPPSDAVALADRVRGALPPGPAAAEEPVDDANAAVGVLADSA